MRLVFSTLGTGTKFKHQDFKHQDTAILGYKKALHIEKVQNEFKDGPTVRHIFLPFKSQQQAWTCLKKTLQLQRISYNKKF